jgi:hypothetical protein
MNKKIGTFIFVHDQKIIIDYIKHEKFKNLSNLKFVFVGYGDVSEIKELDNLIICRDLPFNLEQYPYLTAFSGWYALHKNKLYNDFDYLNLFEYDINVDDNFENIQSEFLDTGIIGYVPIFTNHIAYIKVKQWSEDAIISIQNNYNISIPEVVNLKENNFQCSVTSNHTFSAERFDEYMRWIEPVINDIKHLEMSGHQIERSVSFFYLCNNLDFVIIPNVLHHFQLDSHKNQGIFEYKKNDYKKLF